MFKSLLITGAAGFIGLNFLEKFDASAYDIIESVDKMGYATKYNKARYYELCKQRNINVTDCDINNVDALSECVRWGENVSIDIIDFASESHVDNSIKDPFSTYSQNASIPANILAWIGKSNWGNIKNYFHISTDEVYGQIALEDANDESKWFKTTTNFNPSNPYSASKVAQDAFLMSMRHTFGIPVKFIRMANQFGKHQHKEKMVPASIMRAVNGESIKVYGTGNNIRQWTPVDITATIIADIVSGKLVFDDIIHLSNRWGLHNNNVIVEKLVASLGRKGIIPTKEYIEDRKGHDLCYALTSTPEVDAYYENFDIDKYFDETVQFYIDNKEEYNK
jgi:dTDP-glucose 4,6-dehydratase